MNRNWIFSLTILAASSISTMANAQANWDQPSSYGYQQPVYQSRFPGIQDYRESEALNASFSRWAPQQTQQESQQAPANSPTGNDPVFSNVTPAQNGYYSAPTTYNVMPTGTTGENCDCTAGGLNSSRFGMRSACRDTGGCGFRNRGAGGYTGEVNYGCDPKKFSDRSWIRPALHSNNSDCGLQGFGKRSLFSNSNNERNVVAGVGTVIFARDYEDDVGLSSSGAGGYLFSTDANHNVMGGVETFIQSRNCNGRGWEARYWGLYPNHNEATLGSPLYTSLKGLSELWHGPSGQSVLDVYNLAETHAVCRTNRFNNVEINRLINAGSIQAIGGRQANLELVHGVRWFQFNESFEYSALSTVLSPARMDYELNTYNNLLGYQFGGRSVRCLTDRIHLTSGLRFGLYNNRIRHNQSIVDENGYISRINSGPFSGRPFDYSSNKDDLATLTEADMNLGYLLSSKCRLSLGYRAMGITGLALAPDQIPANFTDALELQRINSNGSMLLHGFYGGLNFCF